MVLYQSNGFYPYASENTVSIEPDSLPVGSVPDKENRSMHFDYSHTIELPEERKSTRFTNIICRMAILYPQSYLALTMIL